MEEYGQIHFAITLPLAGFAAKSPAILDLRIGKEGIAALEA
jgi:hypothetical protein